MELKVNQTPPSLPTVCIGDSTERLEGHRKEAMASLRNNLYQSTSEDKWFLSQTKLQSANLYTGCDIKYN